MIAFRDHQDGKDPFPAGVQDHLLDEPLVGVDHRLGERDTGDQAGENHDRPMEGRTSLRAARWFCVRQVQISGFRFLISPPRAPAHERAVRRHVSEPERPVQGED